MSASKARWPVVLCAVFSACQGAPSPPGGGTATTAPRFRLVDVAARAGLDGIQVGGGATVDHVIDSVGCGGAWLDYDGDGDPDLYLAQGATPEHPYAGPPDRLLRNDGDLDGDGVPDFSDVTESAGLGDRLWSFGVAVADYDNDGDADLYLTNWGPNRLYRNEGDGTFTDVAATLGVDDPGWSAAAAWADTDRDGDLDLYVSNYVDFEFGRYPARGAPGLGGGPPCAWRDLEVFCGPRGLAPGRDRFYRNDGDVFIDATREVGLWTDESYFGLATLFFDSDNDGDADLYVANDSVANMYFVNLGDGTFREDSLLSGLAFNEQGHEQAGMGVAAADFDGNGLLDLAVTNFSHDHDTLYRNDGGGVFTDVSYAAGLGGVSYLTLAWGVSFADLDQDGTEDLLVAHGHVYPQVDDRDTGTRFEQPNSLYRGLPGGSFEEVTAEAGPGMAIVKSSRSLLPADVDADGDLDLAVTNLNAAPDLLLNEGAPGHWLQVRLQGSVSNRDGLGARVTLLTENGTQTREISRTASFAGSTLPVAHFGLGRAKTVERIEVRWPSGRSTVRENVQADRTLLIRESDAN